MLKYALEMTDVDKLTFAPHVAGTYAFDNPNTQYARHRDWKGSCCALCGRDLFTFQNWPRLSNAGFVCTECGVVGEQDLYICGKYQRASNICS